MKELKTEVIINASKESIWKVLTDFPKYSEWNSFMVSIEGPLKVGGKLRNVMVLEEKEQVFNPRITKIIEYKQLEWIGSLPIGLFNGRHYFIIEEISNGQCKLIHGEIFTGWLHKMIMNKIGEKTLERFLEWNEAFKTRVEQLYSES